MYPIAGAEPAVEGERLGGSLRILVIPEHYIVAADLDLSLLKSRVVDPLGVDADAATGDRGSDRAALRCIVWVDRDERRTFGDAVALVDLDPKLLKAFRDRGIHCRSAADYLVYPAAEVIQHLGKQFAARVDSGLAEKLGGRHGEGELLVLAGLLCFVPDALVEGIYDKRYEDESGGLEFLIVFQKVLERIVYAYVHTVPESREHTAKLVGVV